MPRGIYKKTPEHIKKIVDRNKLGQSKEARIKISEAHKGKKLSKIHKEKISKGNFGRKVLEETKKKISVALTGKKLSLEHKEKISKSHIGKRTGKNNNKWKGSNVGYNGVHSWVRRHKGQPTKCSQCGLIGQKNKKQWSIGWANKKHDYKRNLDDYIPLCSKCHQEYDIRNNNYQPLWQRRIKN